MSWNPSRRLFVVALGCLVGSLTAARLASAAPVQLAGDQGNVNVGIGVLPGSAGGQPQPSQEQQQQKGDDRSDDERQEKQQQEQQKLRDQGKMQ
jgi:hypothetical protein